MEKQRIRWIDVAKGIGILLVCVGHTRLGLEGFIASWINSFHMPLFFFLSGVCFDETRYASYGQYCRRKCISLLYPYLMLTLLVAIVMSLFRVGSDVNYFWFHLTPYPGHRVLGFWFIRVLIVVELLYALSVRLGLKQEVCRIAVWGTLALVAVMLPYYYRINTVFLSLVYYELGHVLRNLSKCEMQVDRAVLIVFLAFCLQGGIIWMIGCPVSMYGELMFRMNAGFYFVLSILGITGVIGAAKILDRVPRVNVVLSWLGKYSILLLALHPNIGSCRKTWIDEWPCIGGWPSEFLEVGLIAVMMWFVAVGPLDFFVKMQKCKRVLYILAYWSGVDAIFYFLNRHAKRIVTFHAILPDDLFRPGVANGVSNRLSECLAIIRECQRRYRITNDILDSKTLTVTFDDGYRNQYSVAFKELSKLGVPAYVFAAGDVLSGKVLMVDKLLHWVSEAPIENIPGGDRMAYWSSSVWPRFVADVRGRGETVFHELNSIFPYQDIIDSLPQDYVRERLGPIMADEIREMREAGWQVGWHTQTHSPLAPQSDDELRTELTPPDEIRSVCLCYPFGNPKEVGALAVRVAEQLGYPCAVSDTNTAIENTSRYFMPRMALSPDKYELHFELSGLKHFFKCRRLLPCV